MRQGSGCFEQGMLAGPVSWGCWHVMGVGEYRWVPRLRGCWKMLMVAVSPVSWECECVLRARRGARGCWQCQWVPRVGCCCHVL